MSPWAGARWHWRLVRALRKIAVSQRANLLIPDGLDGWLEVPWALLRPEGIYVCDVLQGSGQLIAGDVLPEWTIVNRGRFRFPNPLPALQREEAAVKLLVGAAVPVGGYLLLQDGLQLARARPRSIISIEEMSKRLGGYGAHAEPGAKIAEAWQRLLAASRMKDPARRVP